MCNNFSPFSMPPKVLYACLCYLWLYQSVAHNHYVTWRISNPLISSKFFGNAIIHYSHYRSVFFYSSSIITINILYFVLFFCKRPLAFCNFRQLFWRPMQFARFLISVVINSRFCVRFSSPYVREISRTADLWRQ